QDFSSGIGLVHKETDLPLHKNITAINRLYEKQNNAANKGVFGFRGILNNQDYLKRKRFPPYISQAFSSSIGLVHEETDLPLHKNITATNRLYEKQKNARNRWLGCAKSEYTFNPNVQTSEAATNFTGYLRTTEGQF
ncbi:hypothetical protein X801_07211, partial [Opisthorchis viverrini]